MMGATRQFGALRSWLGGALVCLGALGAAQAALFGDDQARKGVLDLQERLETLRLASEQGLNASVQDSAALRAGVLNLQNQIQTLRAELANLRGQNEQLARQLSDLQQSQKDELQALAQRLALLEPTKVLVDGRDFLADALEKREYEAAMDVFRSGDFATAQGLLADFVVRYKISGYRPSALFWLGNAQYATGNCKDAVVSFRTLVARESAHLRTPDAVLAIANCQIELKDTAAAKVTLRDLLKAYPASEAAQTAKERLGRLK